VPNNGTVSSISSARPKTDAATALGEAVKIYSRHAFVIVGTSIMVQLVSLMLTFTFMGAGGLVGAAGSLIPLAASMLLTGVLTTILLSIRETGTVPPISEVITRALPMVPAIFGISFLSGIAVGFATIAFILPGIYVYLRLALGPALLVLSRQGVIDSMKASWAITGSAKGSVFVLVMVQFGASFGIVYLAYKAAGGAFANEENFRVAQAFVTALIIPIPTLAFGDLTLRLSGIYPDPATGIRLANTAAGPAHRVHVPSGVHTPTNHITGAQPAAGFGGAQPLPAYGAPQPTPAYGVPQPAGLHGAHAPHQPMQPQPQSLWNKAPQQQAAAHPHFTDPPAPIYAPPPPPAQAVHPFTAPQQPYAQPAPQPYAQPAPQQPQPQPYAQPAPQQPQPYAAAPQPYAAAPAPPYAPAGAQPHAPHQPYGATPVHPHAPGQPQQQMPPRPSRPSVAPPGVG
jgi:hypothetical protein